MSRSTKIAAALSMLAILGAGPAYISAADDSTPASFVSLKFEGACDGQNNRLWLSNTHTFKTVVATVRWRAAGGKDLVEEFFPVPNSIREIGCAADAQIVEAKFADF